ncbi:MAG: hypothetical protein AABY07_09945 [Nanoarchaeota archaeon]
MEVKLSNETNSDIETASKEMGLSKEEIVVRALKLYLSNLKEYLDLKEEIYTWEEATTEDFSNWDKENLKNE